jgi:hypothetical protein
MKLATDRLYANPETAARKLIEIANSVEAVQDGVTRCHVALTVRDSRTIPLCRTTNPPLRNGGS